MKIDMRSFRRRPYLVLFFISLFLSLMSVMPVSTPEARAQVSEEANAETPTAEPASEVAPEAKEVVPAEETSEAPKEEVKAEAPKGALIITDVKIKKIGKFTRAEIITSGEPGAYSTYTLNNPARVVVNIENVGEISVKQEIKATSPHIKGARLGQSGSQGRVVFDSKEGVPYDIVKGSDRVVVFFGRKPEAKEEVKEEVKVESDGKALSILDVKIGKSGKFTKAEVITSGDLLTYNAFNLKAPNRLVVDIGNAREIPAKKEIKTVSPHIKGARLGRYDGQVRIVFDYKREIIPYEVVKEKDRVIVLFGKEPAVTIAEVEKGNAGAKVEEKAEAPKEEVKAEAKVEEEVKPEEKAEAKAEAEGKEMAAKPFAEEAPKGEGARAYTGQKVTLEFKDADIKNIFRIIAEVSGYNMIIDSAVTGKVTIRLVNVPWDQALDLILETNGLGMTKLGNVIRVLPATMIKKAEEDMLASKQIKEKLEDLAPPILIPVSYAKASDIKIRLDNIKTDRGKIDVDDRTNTIIMTDVQKSIDDALKLVKDLDAPTTQIMIEARIVEAKTDFTRDLGVQWGTGYTKDASHGGTTGLYFPNSYNINAGGGGSFALTPPSTGGTGPAGGTVGISFGSINNTLSLDLRLSALETQGWGKIVSSPKVLTLDNKEASIQQGVQIPYQTTSSSGTQTQFVPATLSLNVTPHATADGRLNLKIKVNKDSADRSTTPPSINTNQATTEILVKDGETTVIGGIYSTTKTEGETYTPFLGRIPIIGWLFKSKSVSDNKTELLIFITPRIVRDRPA